MELRMDTVNTIVKSGALVAADKVDLDAKRTWGLVEFTRAAVSLVETYGKAQDAITKRLGTPAENGMYAMGANTDKYNEEVAKLREAKHKLPDFYFKKDELIAAKVQPSFIVALYDIVKE